MRQFLIVTAGVVLSASAWASNCPVEIKAIDAKLETKPNLSKEQMEKVVKLRKSGEDHHKAGKHADSMKDLTEAKKILGI